MDPLGNSESGNDILWRNAVEALDRGDFSRIEAQFAQGSHQDRSQIETWYESGRFAGQPIALAQALTCACMLGRGKVAAFLLHRGVDPAQGAESGQTALHYAASSGHLDIVRLLIERRAPLEAKNMYGGTVLDQALWSAVNESKAEHPAIIQELIAAGANLRAVGGQKAVDEALRLHATQFNAT